MKGGPILKVILKVGLTDGSELALVGGLLPTTLKGPTKAGAGIVIIRQW